MIQEVLKQTDQVHKFGRRKLGQLVLGGLATATLAPIVAACGPSVEQQMNVSVDAFSTAKPDISGWESYQTSKQGFANELHLIVNHPSEWAVEPLSVGDGGLDTTLFAKAMVVAPKNGYLPRVVILSERTLQGMTEDSLFQSQVNAARRDKDLTGVKVTDIKLPGMEAKMLSYVGTYSVLIHSDRLATHTVTLIRNGRVYNFTFRGKPEEIAKDMSVFKGILQSVEFLKQ